MINKTKDYYIFGKHESNRELNPLSLKKLENSIRFKNMLHLRPILVDKKMRIIDGQHRFEVAKKLNLEVYYILDEESEDIDIIQLNNNQKKWGLEDYFNYYFSKSYKEYVDLKEFMNRMKIGKVCEILILLKVHGGKAFQDFRDGKFKMLENTDFIEDTINGIKDVCSILDASSLTRGSFYKSVRFTKALVTTSNKDFFEWDNFLKKIKSQVDKIHQCSSEIAYGEMFKNIYNWRTTKQIE